MAARQPLDRDRVVEIARMFAVNRDRRHGPEVGPPADVPILDGRTEPPRLFDRLLRMRIGNLVLANDDLGVDAGLIDAPEHFDDAAERTAGGRRPLRDLDDAPCRLARPMTIRRSARECRSALDDRTERRSRASRSSTLESPDDLSPALVGES